MTIQAWPAHFTDRDLSSVPHWRPTLPYHVKIILYNRQTVCVSVFIRFTPPRGSSPCFLSEIYALGSYLLTPDPCDDSLTIQHCTADLALEA